MTLLMWFHYDDAFEIITDTSAAALNHRIVGTDQQEFCVFPERKLLVAATGFSDLAHEWWAMLASGHPAGGVIQLADSAPPALVRVWGKLMDRPEAPDGVSATVYHFGFAPDGTPIQTAYESGNSFTARIRLPGGFAVKPPPVMGVLTAPEGDDEVIELALQIRKEQGNLPLQERIPIGGALIRTRFAASGESSSEELFRFAPSPSEQPSVCCSDRRLHEK